MKKPSDERLRQKMNDYAIALLDAHYGGLILPKADDAASLPDDGSSDTTTKAGHLPKPDVFNAVVNWIRTDSGLEPLSKEKSGIAALTDQRNAARK